MGSFGGVKIDAQNFQQAVELAQQKALLGQNRTDGLSKDLMDYRNGLAQSVADYSLVNSEKLLRRNVTGVLNQNIPYNLLLTASEQEANRVAYDKWKIEVERQRLLDLQKLQSGSAELFTIKPFVGNNLPYKQGGILKAGTRVQGDLYAQDMRPIDGIYNEWLLVKIPNSFGGEVRIGSNYIDYNSIANYNEQHENHKMQVIIIGVIALGLLLSDNN